MALQVGCQGLELVLKEQHTTPRNLIMATKLIGILSWIPQLETKGLCLRLSGIIYTLY